MSKMKVSILLEHVKPIGKEENVGAYLAVIRGEKKEIRNVHIQLLAQPRAMALDLNLKGVL